MTFNTRREITALLNKAGISLRDEKRIVQDFDITQGHDIHAFYDLPLDDQTLHVQAYPGMSNEKQFMLNARVMNKDRVKLAREAGASIGNEHSAVTHAFRYMTPSGLYVPYNQNAVNGVLSSCVYETLTKSIMDSIIAMGPHIDEMKRILGGRK